MSTSRTAHLTAVLARSAATAALTAASASAFAAFTNLDFESAQPPAGEPQQILFLDWSVGAPGWSHSSGPDTSYVYYGAPHVGTTQWYLLASEYSHPASLLAGSYSLSFSSGYDDPHEPVNWIQAYIAQTGFIPGNAQYIELLAAGSPFAVSIGGNSIALTALGGNLYRGDISAYAGSTQELRITNLADTQGIALAVDNVSFAVPLPPGFGLYAAGLATIALSRRRCVTSA